MKKKILILSILALFITPISFGQEFKPEFGRNPGEYKHPIRPSSKEIKRLDKFIEERLNLTPEQIKLLKANRQKNFKKLEKTIDKMEANHREIRNIYMLGIPSYQADLKSAPYKLELVILKQNADAIRHQNRKYFESILTPEQKAEFKKLKSELPRR